MTLVPCPRPSRPGSPRSVCRTTCLPPGARRHAACTTTGAFHNHGNSSSRALGGACAWLGVDGRHFRARIKSQMSLASVSFTAGGHLQQSTATNYSVHAQPCHGALLAFSSFVSSKYSAVRTLCWDINSSGYIPVVIITVTSMILPRKRGSMFLPVLVCVSVCVSVTTITKMIVDWFVPNFMGRFLEGKGKTKFVVRYDR